MAQAVVELQDVAVRYGGAPVLRIPSLSVRAGEVLALIGPNGAGKSTLIRVMGLLERPAEGRVYFRGAEVGRADRLAFRRRIATVFQEPLLLHASVYENAALGLKIRGLDRKTIAARLRPWLDRLGIAHLVGRQARSLSGGEAQRTSMARALALEPELLLLDEPFSALDPPTRDGLLGDLQTILRGMSITAVFVTHNRDEAFMLGDRVGVLMRGELLQIAPAAEIFGRPMSEEVAGFVGIETKIPGIVEAVSDGISRVRITAGTVEVYGGFRIGEEVLLCLRSEEIDLRTPAMVAAGYRGQNHLRGKIVEIAPRGFHYRVKIDCDGSLLAASLTRSAYLDLNLSEGDDVIASFKASAAHAIKRE